MCSDPDCCMYNIEKYWTICQKCQFQPISLLVRFVTLCDLMQVFNKCLSFPYCPLHVIKAYLNQGRAVRGGSAMKITKKINDLGFEVCSQSPTPNLGLQGPMVLEIRGSMRSLS